MGLEPPEEYRVLGRGQAAITRRYINDRIPIYDHYHDESADIPAMNSTSITGSDYSVKLGSQPSETKGTGPIPLTKRFVHCSIPTAETTGGSSILFWQVSKGKGILGRLTTIQPDKRTPRDRRKPPFSDVSRRIVYVSTPKWPSHWLPMSAQDLSPAPFVAPEPFRDYLVYNLRGDRLGGFGLALEYFERTAVSPRSLVLVWELEYK